MPHLTQEQIEDQLLSLTTKVDQLEKRIATLTDSTLLHTIEDFGDSVVQPPLDSSVLWKRGRQQSTPGKTHQILSLISEVSAVSESFPWPLYIQLRTAHAKGDAVGATVRLIQSGNGWSTAFHAETFHESNDGTTIGVNIEPRKGTNQGRSVGLDLNSISVQEDGSLKSTVIDEGMLIQSDALSQWLTGIHFDQVSKGVRAIWIEGQWQVGLDVGDNKIRMNQNAELCFEATERFYVKYNPETGRIEFHNRGDGLDRVIGYISGDAPEHEL